MVGDFRFTAKEEEEESVVVVVATNVGGEAEVFGGECSPLMTDLISKDNVVDVEPTGDLAAVR